MLRDCMEPVLSSFQYSNEKYDRRQNFSARPHTLGHQEYLNEWTHKKFFDLRFAKI